MNQEVQELEEENVELQQELADIEASEGNQEGAEKEDAVGEAGEEAVEKEEVVEGEEKPNPNHNKIQRRINKEVGKRKQLERDKDRLARENEELKQRLEAKKKELTIDDFDDYESFDAHQKEILKEKIKKEAQQEIEKERELENQKKSEQERTDAFVNGFKGASKKYSDFKETVQDFEIEIQSELGQALLDFGEVGAELYYYIAKNPNEEDNLLSMNNRQMIRRLGQLEGKLSPSLKKKVSRAAAPISPVNKTGKFSDKPDINNVKDKNAFFENFVTSVRDYG